MDHQAAGATAAGSRDDASAASRDPPKFSNLPERFMRFDDVVAQEIAELDYPWNLKAIEDKIQEYSTISDAINAQLSARVMQNYNEFVQGMQQVQAVETELTLIGVLVKNGRCKLQERDKGLVKGSMEISVQQRKKERLKQLLATLSEFQGVVQIDTRLRQCLASGDYCEAIAQYARLKEALADDRFRSFPGLQGLREGQELHLAELRQKLSEGLRVAAVSAEFDAERYEEILKAYSMMSPDQALSVGKELLRHVNETVVSVSRQCVLAFSGPPPGHESPADWHRKAQLRDLCRSMDPGRFLECTAQLYEHLCDFLYRHQFLCAWHMCRAQVAEGEGGEADAGFREVLRDVLTELAASKRNIWDRIQQQVVLVLMNLEFQYPALSEDSFLHVLNLTQVLIEECDAFMADYQQRTAASGAGTAAEGRRQLSAPIRNTLKAKAHDYFQSLHFSAWASLKATYIEQDTWQRLPVARSYSLLRAGKDRATKPGGDGHAVAPLRSRVAEGNPFRNYKPDPGAAFAPAVHEPLHGDVDPRSPDSLDKGGADDIDEHTLLQQWIDDSESLPHERISSSMLPNSNRSPVVSRSTEELARILERYFRLMGAIPNLAIDIFQSAIQLIEFYVHCVLCLFVQDRHLRQLLEDLDGQQGAVAVDPVKLQARQEAFLLQRLCPELRHAAIRTRDLMCSLALPDSCAAVLNMQPPVTGAVFLQVAHFPKLSSPSSLCGLSERCVGVESVAALLADLREARHLMTTLLPKGGGQEAVDRFLPAQEGVAAQLKTFVLACAARDILEVPDVGRISLDHFSNTIKDLRWDAKDFPQGSPAAPYMEQLREQIKELARRIPCAGGGSIPYATQRSVWGWIEVRIMQECAEVVAKCGRKKSQEALFCMAEDFQSIRGAVQQNFKAAEGAEDTPLLPPGHAMANSVVWTYLDQYLEAHANMPGDALSWCRHHPQYPLRLQKALLDYLHGTQKSHRQFVQELEVFVASYIADESATFRFH